MVSVRKLLTGDRNLHVEAVGTSTRDVSQIAETLQEGGLEIVDSEIIEDEALQPFDHFGSDVVEDREP